MQRRITPSSFALRATADRSADPPYTPPMGEPALLTSRCTNETIDDARSLIDELLTAHPDVAARDFPTHPGKPGHANAADTDVGTEELVSDLRLDCLDGFREDGFLGFADLLPLRIFPGTTQADLVKHE